MDVDGVSRISDHTNVEDAKSFAEEMSSEMKKHDLNAESSYCYTTKAYSSAEFKALDAGDLESKKISIN